MTGGKVGYIHMPDMGADGIREFIKWYYPQIRKEGLIVDVRANGGGNVSRMLIERLSQKVLAAQFSRTVRRAAALPERVRRARWSRCSTRTRRPTATSSPRCSARRSSVR